MLPRRDNRINKSAKQTARKKASSEDESSEEGSSSSGSSSDDGSNSSSGSDSEMDTTETSFSSKSATECVGSSKQQGLLKVNHRSYTVYCDTARNSKNFCHGSIGEPLMEDIKKDPK